MDSEDYKALNDQIKDRRKSTREKATDEINSLRIHPEFVVDKLTEYHFRVNEKWDLYPTTRRIFMVGRTDNFIKWKNTESLIGQLRKLEKDGRIEKRQFELKYFLNGKDHQTVASGVWSLVAKKKFECENSGQYKSGVLRIVDK